MGTVKISVLIPVFNDWDSASMLIKTLRAELATSKPNIKVEVTFVDDGSSEPVPSPDSLSHRDLKVSILRLDTNVGHQLAIMTGLRHVNKSLSTHVLIMDSDGEDTTSGVIRLIEQALNQPDVVIVAQRGIRSEKLSFRIMYHIHKVIFQTLTGKKLDFGNFVLLPKSAVTKINSLADSSSHLPSSILRLGIPLLRVRVDRGNRFFGESKMNFEKLVAHSFASLAVFSDQIMVRIMIFSFFSTLVTTLGIIIVISTRLFTDIATPGWATATVGILLVISFQILSFVGLGTLITLNLNSLRNSNRMNLSSPLLEVEQDRQ
jgi:glycosyltransferase involved in cell wall biosynthesis